MLGRGDVLRLAASEASKTVLLSRIAKEARVLVPGIRGRDLQRARAGNRAQLVARDGSFVDDILVREHGDAIHVLNAVSPGLTCSLPFGEDLAKQAVGRL